MRHPEILPDRQIFKQADILKCAGNAAAKLTVSGSIGDFTILKDYPPAAYRINPTNQIDGGALTRTVRPDQAKYFPLFDLNIQPIDRFQTRRRNESMLLARTEAMYSLVNCSPVV